MRATYNTLDCPICKKPVTVAGAARVSHMRAHVRKGEAREVTRYYPPPFHPEIVFEKISATTQA